MMTIKVKVLSLYTKLFSSPPTYTPSKWSPFVFALALLFNAGDGLLTLLLCRMGVVDEQNPVIEMLLNTGDLDYCLVKILSGSLVLCWLFRRGVSKHRLAWYALIGACSFFGLLTIYYLSILMFCGLVQLFH
jgi:hypothetical protein